MVGEITLLLRAHREGDVAAFDRLVGLLYPDLRRLAGRRMRRGLDTVSPTVLLHETYLSELVCSEMRSWREGTGEGRQFGAWRAAREIGRGGISVVHLAERADGA